VLIQGGSPHLSGVPVNIHQIPDLPPLDTRCWGNPFASYARGESVLSRVAFRETVDRMLRLARFCQVYAEAPPPGYRLESVLRPEDPLNYHFRLVSEGN
jgi:hypothetical protein